MKDGPRTTTLTDVELQESGPSAKRRAWGVARDGRWSLSGPRARWLVAVAGLLLSLTAASAAQAAFPHANVTSPERYKAYVAGDVVLANYSCTNVFPVPTGCEGDVLSGQPFDTATAGRKAFSVWARGPEASVNAPVPYWVVGIASPTVDQEIGRGASVPADVDCAIDYAVCDATVVVPGGASVPITDGAPLPSAVLGAYELRIQVTNSDGGNETSTVTRSYRVVDGTQPTVTFTSPTPDQAVALYAPLSLHFTCEDEPGGSGIDPEDPDACRVTLAGPGLLPPLPGGIFPPIPWTNGVPLPTVVPASEYLITVTATDRAGNQTTATRRYRVVQDVTAPTVSIVAPDPDQEIPQDATRPVEFSCADDENGSGLDPDTGCAATLTSPGGTPVPIALGADVPSSTLGVHEIVVTAKDRAGNTNSATRTYRVVDVTDPSATIVAPTPDQEIPQGATVPVAFSCADDDHGSGLDPDEGCVATVTPPGGSPTPIATGDDVPSATPGVHEIVVTAKDRAGNTATTKRTYRVLAPPTEPDPVSDPKPNPQGPSATVPAPPTTQVPPAPVAARTCPVRAVELLTIRPTGTRARPSTRLHGWADRSLAGDVVAIRRDGRTVGRTTVRRDGSVAATVAAPRGARARSRARYRIVVGDLQSRALKATRQLVYTTVTRRGDGSVVVAGRSTLPRAPRRYDLIAGSTCGVGPSTTTRVRADRNGRFRVVLRPPTSGQGVIYRLRAAGRSATLPVVVLAR